LGALQLYSYASCSTCRRALRWLHDRGVAASISDITVSPPPLAQLEQALVQLGRSRLLNTSGVRYRELGAATVRAWSDAELLQALAADGRLIKRPFLVAPDGTILTGFDPSRWDEVLSGLASP
jgi:arsenate reductase